MSDRSLPTLATHHAAALPPVASLALREAFAVLEKPSLASRLAASVGAPVEALAARLPAPIRAGLNGAVRAALTTAMDAALRTEPEIGRASCRERVCLAV